MQNVEIRKKPLLRSALCILRSAFIGALIIACTSRPAHQEHLKFWGLGREGEVVAQMLPEFTRRTGIRVDVQQIPWSAAHEKLLTAFVGDATPDLAQMGNTWIPEFVAVGAIEGLQPFLTHSTVQQRDYFPGIWATNEELRDELRADEKAGRRERNARALAPQPSFAHALFDPFNNLLAAESPQVFIVYARGLTQPKKNELMPPLAVGEIFGEVASGAADVAMNVARIREPALTDERVRADAEAVILQPPPVAKIVLRLLAGSREVADLILREPRVA